MYIAILGRQPALGMAELEHLYGTGKTRWFSDLSACIDDEAFSLNHLGGAQKAGRVTLELKNGTWHDVSTKIIQAYGHTWSRFEGKLTVGISAYGFNTSARDVQKTGIILKQRLKKNNVNIRLIPNIEPALNSATSHHNKLGLSHNKQELIIVKARNGRILIAESIGAQNITAYTRRDQERPKRDAFVGMLPPKLAQIMINLALPHTSNTERHGRVLDPFCGTGVILQEASLMGYSTYGTDLSEKMVEFSQTNMRWLADSHHMTVNTTITQADAMDTRWKQPIDSVVCESYLGQPFNTSPSPDKLEQVRKNCNHIITDFLKNIGQQIISGTPLCVAVPAWRDSNGQFQHLPVIKELSNIGFTQYQFEHISNDTLLYYRENQIVARELLVLVKT